MISFTKPTNLDGAKLIDELVAAGVSIIGIDPIAHLGKTAPSVIGDELLLDIAEADKTKAAAVVAAHNG
jgi:hypothetical protein